MSILTVPASVPPRMPTAPASCRKQKWTVEEFHRVRATGVWDGLRTYLIRGEIWEQGPMNPRHANCVDRVREVLGAVFGAGYRLRVQTPVVLGDSSPFPDLAVVKGGLNDFETKHPTTAALIVEIADSSLFEDTTTKAEVYATARILDYWVVDIENRRLLVFRDPSALPGGGSAYRTCLNMTDAESVAPLAAPKAVVRVGDLFPPLTVEAP